MQVEILRRELKPAYLLGGCYVGEHYYVVDCYECPKCKILFQEQYDQCPECHSKIVWKAAQ